MTAHTESKDITPDDFVKVSKMVCEKVPQLKDVIPVGYNSIQAFPYWGTVHYLLKRRHFNKKGETKIPSLKRRKRKTAEDQQVENDDTENHYKQLMIEMKKKKGNEAAIIKIQDMTFLERKKDIDKFEDKGKDDYIDRVVRKYPFLQDERRLMHELELYVQGEVELKEDASVKTFLKKWNTIAPLFCDEDNGDTSGIALENIHTSFHCNPIITFLKTSKNMDQEIASNANSKAPQLMAYHPDEVEEDDWDEDGQIFVVVDKKVLFEIEPKFSHALLLLLAVYYSFNLRYDDNQKLLYTFLEEHVLGIRPPKRTFRYRKYTNTIFKKKKN